MFQIIIETDGIPFRDNLCCCIPSLFSFVYVFSHGVTLLFFFALVVFTLGNLSVLLSLFFLFLAVSFTVLNRHDTAETIANVRAAGVGVKMITGDHVNIARKTAEQIKLGTVCIAESFSLFVFLMNIIFTVFVYDTHQMYLCKHSHAKTRSHFYFLLLHMSLSPVHSTFLVTTNYGPLVTSVMS